LPAQRALRAAQAARAAAVLVVGATVWRVALVQLERHSAAALVAAVAKLRWLAVLALPTELQAARAVVLTLVAAQATPQGLTVAASRLLHKTERAAF
jgi:hypothetical protein